MISVDRRLELALPWRGFMLVNAALVAWEISFLAHEGPHTGFPTHYHCWLFMLGVASSCAGYFLIWRSNATCRKLVAARKESGPK